MPKFKLNVGYTVARVYQQNGQSRVSVVLYVDLKSSQIDLEIGQFDDSAIALFPRTSLKHVLVSMVNSKMLTIDQYNTYCSKLEQYSSLSKEEKSLVDNPTNEIFVELADLVGTQLDSTNAFSLELEDDAYETVRKEYKRKDGTTFSIVEMQPAVGNLIGSLTSKGVVPVK